MANNRVIRRSVLALGLAHISSRMELKGRWKRKHNNDVHSVIRQQIRAAMLDYPRAFSPDTLEQFDQALSKHLHKTDLITATGRALREVL